jgi:glycosyltransferase involved in cell wall biosynthesis
VITRLTFMIGTLGIGGAERFLMELVRRIPRERYAVQVVCIARRGPWGERLSAEGFDVVELGKRTGLDFFILARLVRQLRRFRPHLVNTHLWTADLWGRLAALLARTPVVVVTEQNVDVWKRPVHEAIDALLGRGTDAVICVSREVESFYRSKGVPAEKLHVIPNAIDISAFDGPLVGSLRAEVAAAPDDFLFLSAARLHPQKAQDILLDATRRLADAGHRRFRLLLAGEGSLREPLEARMRELGIAEWVRFLGVRHDLVELLRQADAFVLPSLYEGLPLAILEAMAARLPVIATRVGGCPEVVIDGQSGRLVAPGNADQLAEAMVALMASPARARAMGLEGRRIVEAEYRIERSAARTLALFADCLARKGIKPCA